MRKLALLSLTAFGLSMAAPAFAQSDAGPQPGLPPGARVGAPNAGSPPPSGVIASTPTAPAAAPASRPVVHHTVHRTRRHAVVKKAAPAAQ